VILGIGTDICDIGRIAGALERQGDRFANRVFTPAERAAASVCREREVFYASRFAAKEACVKALGTGISTRVRWHDIEVINAGNGHSVLTLGGGALARLKRLTPKGRAVFLHLSLSNNPATALAFVVIEARPSDLVVPRARANRLACGARSPS
jgi:holo-[acyl-carrier protein] synthase